MQVRFWGVRGSFATPGSHFLRYGGNTPAVEITSSDAIVIATQMAMKIQSRRVSGTGVILGRVDGEESPPSREARSCSSVLRTTPSEQPRQNQIRDLVGYLMHPKQVRLPEEPSGK